MLIKLFFKINYWLFLKILSIIGWLDCYSLKDKNIIGFVYDYYVNWLIKL